MDFLDPAIDRYRPERPVPVHFVIISGARTGSSHLASLLGNHPDCVCFTELFHASRVALPRSHATVPLEEVYRWRRSQPVEFIEQIFERHYAANIGAVGFKLLDQQARGADERVLWEWLDGHPEIRVIHTVRANLLAQYLSIRQALARRQWVAQRLPDEGPLRLALPEDECENMFIQTEARVNRTRQRFAGHPYLEIEYDDLVAGPREVTRRVCAFLGLVDRPLTSQLVRMNPWPPEACIRNYAELKALFRDTPWARFFSA